jgi:hypothetical protein
MEQLFILVEHGNFQLLHDIVHQNPSLVNATNKDGDTLYDQSKYYCFSYRSDYTLLSMAISLGCWNFC